MTYRTNAGFGWHPSLPDHRDRIYNLEERVLQGHLLPAKADLWPNVPPIWDQGQIGACTAHGSLRAYLTEGILQGASIPMLSRLMQYYDARALEGTTGSDSGATVRDAIKALATDGCAPESEWPYDITQFATSPPAKAYADAKQHMAVKYQQVMIGRGAPIRTALASGLAVTFGFPVPQAFEDGSWDPSTEPLPLPNPSQGFIGGHCVTLTGYDFTLQNHPHPYFVADNSWGERWGGTWGGAGCNGGRFALDWHWFDPFRGLASDLWVIQAVK